MTLGSILLTGMFLFAGLIAFGLLLDALMTKRKGKAEASKALVKPAPAPRERLYTQDEVRALALEFHRRKAAEQPRTVKFEDGWYDPETGEVFSN